MSLTKQQFMKIAASRIETIPVDGFGDVIVRSIPPLTLSRREISLRDVTTGDLIPEELERAQSGIYDIVDQIMADKSTPMFCEDDIPAMCELDAARLAPLRVAIQTFNEIDGVSDAKNG